MTESMTDRTVETGTTAIAVREYGGSGQPVLLLHGAGGNLATWDIVGPMLSTGYQPVAVDLRGHGESSDGPWSWDTVLSDLEMVVTALDVRQAAVVGHSLGGVLAARWAHRHPECPAAVSLDGHRSPVTRPENYDAGAAGLTTEELGGQVERLSALFDAQTTAMAAPLSEDQVEAMLAAQRSFAEQHGNDADRWAAAVRRGLITHNGATFVRPGAETMNALRDCLQADSLPVFAELKTPLLLVLATDSVPQVPAELEPLMVAFRAGLRRDLEALRVAHPAIEIREIDASHGMLFEKPSEIADMITTFIAKTIA
ncbi:alpha/beta fold hydrolase [Phytoactinopolyspora endophytica]|uniref:alpha/beta fold hydrolase n=1 Tax=Phytoactinopolyspora endophytica TaxID=1642495 RepID=UPI00101E000D|nr:alpha/beta hydrolase [Phytoactinopolyspora endophytica]